MSTLDKQVHRITKKIQDKLITEIKEIATTKEQNIEVTIKVTANLLITSLTAVGFLHDSAISAEMMIDEIWGNIRNEIFNNIRQLKNLESTLN